MANIIANTMNGNFRKLNAVSSGVADAKVIIEEGLKIIGSCAFNDFDYIKTISLSSTVETILTATFETFVFSTSFDA